MREIKRRRGLKNDPVAGVGAGLQERQQGIDGPE
jgi:hypothetical protein